LLADINALSCRVEEGFEVIRRDGSRIDSSIEKTLWTKILLNSHQLLQEAFEKVGVSLTCHHN
jgi:hypothetical protein